MSAARTSARWDDDKAGPERICVVTRRKGAPGEMIRFVVAPDGAVVADVRRKLPGRGVWVTADAAAVADAVRKQAFSRGFKRKVAASPSLVEEVDRLLAEDCLQFLALANKAGQAVAGFGKVAEMIGGAGVGALIHAGEAGEDGIRKLAQCLRRRYGGDNVRPTMQLFGSEQLDLAFGRSNVVHAALAEGPTAAAFVERCRRLASYRAAGRTSAQGPED